MLPTYMVLTPITLLEALLPILVIGVHLSLYSSDLLVGLPNIFYCIEASQLHMANISMRIHVSQQHCVVIRNPYYFLLLRLTFQIL